MNLTEHKASIDEASEKFQNHLNEENNFRIIFSGKYGIGKSYFLSEFFRTREERYNKFTISPVNYVVSSNEDIFELIKVDIIMQLFENGMLGKERKTKSSKIDTAGWFINKEPIHLLKFFSTAVKKISVGTVTFETEFLKAFLELKDAYDKYTIGFEKEMQTEDETFEKFLSSFSETSGNIYESNFITKLINEKLEAHKGAQKNKKENVLIIEDLDRIDPDHIFRIFNILSAHNNFFGEQNKFAFDKIILVCDIENIAQIFEHRYGPKVDFDGYIDKFYSTKIFKYSNTYAIGVFVNSLNLGLAEKDQVLLKSLLISLVDNNILRMRQLMKYRQKSTLANNTLVEIMFDRQIHTSSNVNFINSYIDDGVLLQLKSNNLSFLKIIDICSTLFGEFSKFVEALEKLKSKGVSYLSSVDDKDDSILETLSFPVHVSNSLTSAKHLTFYNVENVSYNNSKIIIHPKIRLGKFDFTFELIWNQNQLYLDNTNDYFLSMKIRRGSHNGNSGLDHVDAILKIVTIFHAQKVLYRAGITTDY